MPALSWIWKLPRNVTIALIRLYQKTLSPDHSWVKEFFPDGFCRFYPSCSQYGIDAYKKYGFVKGFFKSTWRILRCNPWSKGGEDRA